MAIGVKVDPVVIVSGTVVMVSEKHEHLDDMQKAAGKVAAVEGYRIMFLQESGATVEARMRLDKNGALPFPLPVVGQFGALECRVSEGSFFDQKNGREVQYVHLNGLRPADNALDMIMSSYAAQSKKAA